MTAFRRFFQRQVAVLGLLLLLTAIGRVSAVEQVLILASQATISESDNTALTFTFIRPSPVSGGLSINYTISGSATFDEDYTVSSPTIDESLSDTITIPGVTPFATITLTIANDALAESAEIITVTIDDDGAGGTLYTTPVSDNDSIVILDDEPVLEIAPGVTAGEPGTNGKFTVSYPAPPRTTPVAISFAVSGTAVAGVDYQTLATVMIPKDVNSIDIPVTILNDTLADDGKVLTVTLVSSIAYQIKPGSGSASMILGNDDTGITNVSAVNPGDSFGLDASIDITVTFSEAVAVSGSPTLELDVGSTSALAQYVDGNGTTTLKFRYTVGPDDLNPHLDYTGTAALALNGGTISRLGTTTPAVLVLPTPGQAGSLSANRDLNVNGLANGQKPVPGTPQSTDSHTSQCGFGQGISALLLLCMLAGLTLSVRRIQR